MFGGKLTKPDSKQLFYIPQVFNLEPTAFHILILILKLDAIKSQFSHVNRSLEVTALLFIHVCDRECTLRVR